MADFEGECKKSEGHYFDSRFHTNLVEALNQLKKENRLCDVAIICENERIHAHKIVLVSASDYFHAMFAGGMSESRPFSSEVGFNKCLLING